MAVRFNSVALLNRHQELVFDQKGLLNHIWIYFKTDRDAIASAKHYFHLLHCNLIAIAS